MKAWKEFQVMFEHHIIYIVYFLLYILVWGILYVVQVYIITETMLCPVGMMTETKSLRYSSPEWYWDQDE